MFKGKRTFKGRKGKTSGLGKGRRLNLAGPDGKVMKCRRCNAEDHFEKNCPQKLHGMGYINDTPAGRLLRDAKLYEIGAGTSEIRRWLIGRELYEETG